MNFDLTGEPDEEMTIDQFKALLLKMGNEEPEAPPEPVPEPEPIVPDDILNLFAMDIPESVPVEGWTLEVPMGDMCVWDRPQGHVMRELTLVPEVRRWCDENIREPYWFLGEGIVGATTRPWDQERTAMLYFTLELDYIMFKMRWG